MGRHYENLPKGARTHLEAMAHNGLLSETIAAQALGMPLRDFRKVIRENPDAAGIWNDALAIERDNLLKALYDRAADGDTKAAQTLLAVRHGLNEKTPQRPSETVSVNIHLPASMDAEKYLEAIRVDKQRAVTHEQDD